MDEEVERILEEMKVCSVNGCDNKPIMGGICCRACKSRLIAKYDRKTIEEFDPSVYFIIGVGTDKVKIGYSANVKARLSELQVGSPVKLLLVGYFKGDIYDERRLHIFFEKHNSHGEWFYFSDEIIDFVEKVNNKGRDGIKDVLAIDVSQ